MSYTKYTKDIQIMISPLNNSTLIEWGKVMLVSVDAKKCL